MTRQTQSFQVRTSTGFSMIDVLVSIIVLATAMLALAALQGTLTRNSADSRARTQVAAFTEGALDELRSSGYGNIKVTGTTTIQSTTVCSSLSGAEKTICQNRSAAETAAGVSNLVTKITYAQYAKTSNSNANFSLNTGTPNTDTGAYKQVDVNTQWTDASGQSRQMKMDTIISYTTVNIGDNTLVTNQPPPKTAAISPTVRQYNPGATAGVIPIAIGSSTDTAATNPKPEVLGSKNPTAVGVSFDVLTYQSPDSNNESIIQKNVDTKVIACSCQFGGVVSTDSQLTTVFAQPYTPTYWDGTHYVSPDPVSGTTTSSTGVDSTATQDVDCDVCCRDRNDVAGNTVLFDPFSGDYNHYQYVSGVLTKVSSGTYVNACRLIRVDGVYTTATDIQNYFLNLLGTDSAADTKVPSSSTSTQPASSPIPADNPPSSFAYVTDYQKFIKGYLNDSLTNFVAGTGPASPNSSPLTSPANTAVNDYTANAPTDPTNINITYSASSPDYRYLHTRGLYIDHLESKAVTAIANAYNNCPTGSTKSDCVLPLVPFTTINLTELASWSTDVNGVIAVSNSAIVTNTSDYFQNPLRGIVNVVSGSVANNTVAYAEATTGFSNSGLTGVSVNWAINPYDNSHTLTDSQKFTVSSSSGSGSNSIYFDVNLTGLAWMNTISNTSLDPSVSWSGTAAQLGTATSGTTTLSSCSIPGTDTDTYVGTSSVKSNKCTNTPVTVATTTTPPVGLTVTVQGYNNTNTTTQTVSCSGGGSFSVSVNQCMSYPIDTTKIYVNSTNVTGATVSYTGSGKTQSASILLPSTPGVKGSSATPDLIKIAFGTGSISQTLTGTCSACTTKGNKTTCSTSLPASCP